MDMDIDEKTYARIAEMIYSDDSPRHRCQKDPYLHSVHAQSNRKTIGSLRETTEIENGLIRYFIFP